MDAWTEFRTITELTTIGLAEYEYHRLRGKISGIEEYFKEYIETIRQLLTEDFWGGELPTTDSLQCILLVVMGLIC
jgi:hypothetical protein